MLLLFLFVCLAVMTQAQEVEPIQNTLITKVTATWCINCGTWGWAAHKSIIEENTENALFLNAHYSGDLQTSTSLSLSRNFNSFGQPQFFVNNTNTFMSSRNRLEKQAEIATAVQTNASEMPLAGTASTHQVNNEALTVTTKVEFFQEMAGSFFLAHYILENGVMNVQTGQGGVVAHTEVIRGATTQDDFGVPITSDKMTISQDAILSSDWNADNLDIVSVIWKKEGNKYLFVNGSMSSTGANVDPPMTMEETEEMGDSTIVEETTDTGNPPMETEEIAEETPDTDNPPAETGDTIQIIEIVIEETPSTDPTPMGEAPDFPEFPWIATLLNAENCCDHTSISVYNSGAYQFVYIAGDAACSNNMGTLYFQDGTFYCADSPTMDCRAAYRLTEADLAKSWTCADATETSETTEEETDTTEETEPMEEETDMTEETEEEQEEAANAPNFEDFPWLNDLVDTQNCCDNIRVTAYYVSIYTYIYIESDSNCSNQSNQLYFQDGTFYCGEANGMDCRGAYNLSAERSSVLWNCSN